MPLDHCSRGNFLKSGFLEIILFSKIGTGGGAVVVIIVTNGNNSIKQKIIKNDIVTFFFTILKFFRDIVRYGVIYTYMYCCFLMEFNP
jgi:hypothetical protein